MTYESWRELRSVRKYRIQTTRPVKEVRKSLVALFQKPGQKVRDFALEVEDTLAEFISASAVGVNGTQR